MKKMLIILFLLLITSTLLYSQDTADKSHSSKDGRSFRDIALLSDYNTVIQKIKSDSLLILDPISDFEDFEEAIPNWVVAQMPPLMNKIYYHFFDNQLYVISLFFNTKKTSYPELYQSLKKNYGKPLSMTSQESRWQLPNNTLVVLDTLPSIKYIDSTLFTKLKEQEGTKDPLQSLIQQEKELEAKIISEL